MKKKLFEKSLTMPKKLKGRTLCDFSSIVAKLQKIEGGPFVGKKVFEKSRTVPKKWTLWSRPVLYVTRETFLVQFLGPTGTFWRLLKIL